MYSIKSHSGTVVDVFLTTAGDIFLFSVCFSFRHWRNILFFKFMLIPSQQFFIHVWIFPLVESVLCSEDKVSFSKIQPSASIEARTRDLFILLSHLLNGPQSSFSCDEFQFKQSSKLSKLTLFRFYIKLHTIKSGWSIVYTEVSKVKKS